MTTAALDQWVRTFADLVAANRDYLTELDSAIGDADHGSNMDRGMKAAVAALDESDPQSAGALFKQVGMTLVSTVGGASGPLFGTFFLRMGTSFGDTETVTPQQFAAAVRAGLEGVVARGKAEPGDKTMLDALIPAADALAEGGDLVTAAERAADAAEEGMRATIPLVARKGRASYLGDRSSGHQDPGATSSALMMRAAAQAFANPS